jgi:uncharacterized membrane protein YhfC
MHNILYSLNFILMITMPLILGWLIHRNRSVRWRLFGIGCVTFIVSQMAHIPFNYFVFPLVQEQVEPLSDLARLLITAAFLGLSAGLFEEITRYFGYRFWAKDARSWGKAMMLGAGHGGVEAIILGILVGINTVMLIAWKNDRFTALIPAEQEPLIAAALDAFFSTPWYETILGSMERFFAISFHLSLSLMVMFAYMRRSWGWLLLAVLYHALVDAIAVISVTLWGAVATEALLALASIASISFILRLRTPEPVEPEPEPLPEFAAPAKLQMDVTPDKLDESKYSS